MPTNSTSSSRFQPYVLMGAVALAEKKDNAGAAKYFALALKEGSEEPTTFMNLATARSDRFAPSVSR